MNEELTELEQLKITDFLKKKLWLDIEEGYYGFNGEKIIIKLMLGDDELSDVSITTKEDEG